MTSAWLCGERSTQKTPRCSSSSAEGLVCTRRPWWQWRFPRIPNAPGRWAWARARARIWEQVATPDRASGWNQQAPRLPKSTAPLDIAGTAHSAEPTPGWLRQSRGPGARFAVRGSRVEPSSLVRVGRDHRSPANGVSRQASQRPEVPHFARGLHSCALAADVQVTDQCDLSRPSPSQSDFFWPHLWCSPRKRTCTRAYRDTWT